MRYSKAFGLAVVFSALATPSQAFIFLLLAGAGKEEKPKPPPTLRALPGLNVEREVRPSGLPAPYLLSPQSRPMPGLRQELAQNNSDELKEMRRRLDQLEEENRKLRSQNTQSAPRSGLPGSSLPAQVTSGWWVHLHNHNPTGDLGPGPIRTYRYEQQEFPATIGFKETNVTKWSEINIYRFEAWLRVAQSGTYQVGAILNCAWAHRCNYNVSLDGILIGQYAGPHGGTNNQLVFGARHLEPGDYRMEMVFYIANTNFLKYEPNLVTMKPQVRTAADMNFRDFSHTELLIPDRRDVPIGPTIQRRGW